MVNDILDQIAACCVHFQKTGQREAVLESIKSINGRLNMLHDDYLWSLKTYRDIITHYDLRQVTGHAILEKIAKDNLFVAADNSRLRHLESFQDWVFVGDYCLAVRHYFTFIHGDDRDFDSPMDWPDELADTDALYLSGQGLRETIYSAMKGFLTDDTVSAGDDMDQLIFLIDMCAYRIKLLYQKIVETVAAFS